MNITTAYRQMAQDSYDEAMQNSMAESVELEEASNAAMVKTAYNAVMALPLSAYKSLFDKLAGTISEAANDAYDTRHKNSLIKISNLLDKVVDECNDL